MPEQARPAPAPGDKVASFNGRTVAGARHARHPPYAPLEYRHEVPQPEHTPTAKPGSSGTPTCTASRPLSVWSSQGKLYPRRDAELPENVA
jgi:hypothetical protein